MVSFEIDQHKLNNIHLQYVTRLDFEFEFRFGRKSGKSCFFYMSQVEEYDR